MGSSPVFYHRKIVDSFLDQLADKGISNLANYAQYHNHNGIIDLERWCTQSLAASSPYIHETSMIYAMAVFCLLPGLIARAPNLSSIGKLDVGDGKELNLECCHIIDLHSQCIKCLGPLRSTVPFSNSSKGC
ncbi:hypothetical protein RHGRI_014271 [Rhododendron griersonianum]|uniref:Uncharacterized protein n=1 Tax=Rhododendron griersonianum TaxID=479676 RepID=A0AAV6K929_9ERIC|nr:hypothetical protein RHGRI_014271 [Rhododendron griersonianum]